ncbi:hypothetical protein YTPLAS18_25180 [Nitrospira sp.]|nr:hypothetical protein YTPLAS18_25180 [Nitrospira sp.]
MILLYHKVHPQNKTCWWVDVETFHRQLLALQGRKVVYLDDYDPSDEKQVVITFDGVYENVLQYAAPLLRMLSYPFELFVTSDYVGRDNAFDRVEPLATFADEAQLATLVSMGGRLQWHSRTHLNLGPVTDRDRIVDELEVPPSLRSLDPSGFRWFAYPHGDYNNVVVEEVRTRFTGGLSCVQGNDSDRYTLNRLIVSNDTALEPASRVAVIVVSYNYGQYLPEAVESVLRQTRKPDEVHIVDDCSEDNTSEIGRYFADKSRGTIFFHRNASNLGIIETFNQAVQRTAAQFVCILGADNRLRSDYVERLSALLSLHPHAAVAYTDYALFGSRARLIYDQNPRERQGRIIKDHFFVVSFPDFSPEARGELGKANFIHGSSMFRRQAFDQVGGYKQEKSRAEDHSLFVRMVQAGWDAVRSPYPLLEYRQHSREQANIRLSTHIETQFYRQLAGQREKELAELSGVLAERNRLIGVLEEKMSKLEGHPHVHSRMRRWLVRLGRIARAPFADEDRRWLGQKLRERYANLRWPYI